MERHGTRNLKPYNAYTGRLLTPDYACMLRLHQVKDPGFPFWLGKGIRDESVFLQFLSSLSETTLNS